MWTEDEAKRLAENRLAGALPQRWEHVQGVAVRATRVRSHLEHGSQLVTASWLHDIGYAPGVCETGFHPLDGARALRAWGAGDAICDLVAHHSAAAHEAHVLGLLDELSAFTDPDGLVRDLLWYFDMTTSPEGSRVSFGDRMEEIRGRYPADHYVIRALDVSMADRRSAVDRAEVWLSDAGLAGQV